MTPAHTRRRKEAVDVGPIIDMIQASVDRLRRAHAARNVSLVGASLDLQLNVEDLIDAVDKNERES